MIFKRRTKKWVPPPPAPTEDEIAAAITEAGAVMLDAFSAASSLDQQLKSLASTRAEMRRMQVELERRVREFEDLRGRVATLQGLSKGFV